MFNVLKSSSFNYLQGKNGEVFIARLTGISTKTNNLSLAWKINLIIFWELKLQKVFTFEFMYEVSFIVAGYAAQWRVIVVPHSWEFYRNLFYVSLILLWPKVKPMATLSGNTIQLLNKYHCACLWKLCVQSFCHI